jgi:methylenetetrahydrofolate reductase (NADPH)
LEIAPGATFFTDNADFFMFRDHLTRRLSVNVPLVPGVIPILSAAQITKFAQLSGGKIPPGLRAKLDKLSSDDGAVTEFGIEYATRQCEELLRAGVPGLHFYANKSYRRCVLKNLDRPATRRLPVTGQPANNAPMNRDEALALPGNSRSPNR